MPTSYPCDPNGLPFPVVARVSLGAVRRNLHTLRSLLPGETTLAAVVKSDAYGHGMEAVARVAIEEGSRFLVVTCLAEALALRQAGLTAEILIAGPIFAEEAPEIVSQGFVVFLGSLAIAQALDRAARDQRRPARVHLKIDTGMGRFGFLDTRAQLGHVVESLLSLRELRIEGALTHFSEADDPASDFTQEQSRRFRLVLRELESAGIMPQWIHAANSGGVVHHPHAAFSLVRVGLALYGINPGPEPSHPLNLEPAMTLMCRVADLRDVPAGMPVSYGRTYKTSRPSRLAVLPVGYGNGYPRHASNRAEAIVRGQRTALVGRVTMNQIVADVTDIPHAEVGDPVLLFGRLGKDALRVEEVAQAAETIPYEVVCNVGRCAPRVIVEE